MWRIWDVHTGDLAPEQVSWAKSIFLYIIKSNTFCLIALNVAISLKTYC